MSNLQLSVDLSLSDKLSQALEKVIKPAQELSDEFDNLKKTVEQFKLPNIDTKNFDKLKDEAQGVIKETERLNDKLRDLDKLKFQLEGFDKVKKETVEAATKLTALKQVVKNINQEIDGGNTDPALAKRLRLAQKEMQKLENTVNKGRERLGKMNDLLTKNGMAGVKLSEAQKKINADIKKTEVAIGSQQGTLNRLNNAYGNHAKMVAQAKSVQDSFKQKTEQTNKAIEKQQSIIEKAQKVREYSMEALRIAGAAAGGLGYAVKEYAASQDAQTTLKISMMGSDGKVAKEYAQINKLAEKLGTKLPGTTADFKKMMAVLVQQGISFQSILGGVGEASGNLAVLLKMPFDEAAQFAAKLQDATKTTEKDMMHLMDTVQKMYYLGADTTNIMGGFGNLASSMAVLGKSGKAFVDEVAPLLVMTDQAGMNGDSAGNAYRKIFASMMDTDGINKALADAGVNAKFDFTDGKGEWGGFEKMFAQLQQLKGIDTQKRLQVLSDAFGGDQEVARALNVMIEKGQAGYDETVQKMAKQADINKRVQAQLGTLNNLWDALGGTVSSLLARAGEALAPWVEAITVKLTQWGEKLGALIDEHPQVFGVIMKFIAVIAAVVAVIASLAVVISTVVIPMAALKLALLQFGGITGIFTKLGTVFGSLGGHLLRFGGLLLKAASWLNPLKLIPAILSGAKVALVALKAGAMAAATGIRTLAMAFLTNPIGLAIAGIAVAALLIYKYWNPIKAFFAGVWEGIKASLAPLQPMFDGIEAAFSTLGSTISPVIDWLKSLFNITQVGEGNARSLGQTVGGFLVNAFLRLTAPIRIAWDTLKWLWDSMTGLFSGQISIGDIFAGLWAKFDGAVAKITEWKDKAVQLWDDFWSVFKSKSSPEQTATDTAGTGGGGFWSSIASGLETAKTTISEKAGGLWESAKSKFDEAKISLGQKAGEIWSSVTNALDGASGGIGIGAMIASTMSQIISAIGSAASSIGLVFSGIIATVSAGVTGIVTVFGTVFSAIPSIVGVAMSGLPAIFAAALGVLPAMVGRVFSGLATTVGFAMMSIINVIRAKMIQAVMAITQGFVRMRTVVATMWRSLGSAMSGNPILSKVQSAMNATLGYLGGIKGRFVAIGADIASGLARGIQSNIGQVKAASAQLAAAVESASRVQLDTHSPSRVMMAVGHDVVAGLDVGMLQRFKPTLANFNANMGQIAHNPTPVVRATPAIGRSVGVSHYTGGAVNITINAPAGSNSQDIAQLVAKELQKHQKNQALRQRASFRDAY